MATYHIRIAWRIVSSLHFDDVLHTSRQGSLGRYKPDHCTRWLVSNSTKISKVVWVYSAGSRSDVSQAGFLFGVESWQVGAQGEVASLPAPLRLSLVCRLGDCLKKHLLVQHQTATTVLRWRHLAWSYSDILILTLVDSMSQLSRDDDERTVACQTERNWRHRRSPQHKLEQASWRAPFVPRRTGRAQYALQGCFDFLAQITAATELAQNFVGQPQSSRSEPCVVFCADKATGRCCRS